MTATPCGVRCGARARRAISARRDRRSTGAEGPGHPRRRRRVRGLLRRRAEEPLAEALRPRRPLGRRLLLGPTPEASAGLGAEGDRAAPGAVLLGAIVCACPRPLALKSPRGRTSPRAAIPSAAVGRTPRRPRRCPDRRVGRLRRLHDGTLRRAQARSAPPPPAPSPDRGPARPPATASTTPVQELRDLHHRPMKCPVLLDAFHQAVADRSCQLFTVLGVAGVGKSRLVAEVLETIDGAATVAAGRCLPYGDGLTWWPLVEALGHSGLLEQAAADDQSAAARAPGLLKPAGEPIAPEEAFVPVRIRLADDEDREQVQLAERPRRVSVVNVGVKLVKSSRSQDENRVRVDGGPRTGYLALSQPRPVGRSGLKDTAAFLPIAPVGPQVHRACRSQ
jgi:AAA ATPase domain